MAEITREHLQRHVDPKLRRRLRIYLGISAAIVLIIVYRVFMERGALLYVVGAFVLGLGVGIALSRMFALSWDEDAAKVLSRIDAYGTIFLVAAIAFEVGGEHVIKAFFHGPDTLTIILALAGGSVLGRGIGMGRKMLRVLRENI